MPLLICLQRAQGSHRHRAVGANTVPRARHTRARRGKPAKLSQFPTPTLRNDSAPHGCKAQQAWAGPDNGDSRGTGSESPICTDAFFPAFFLFLFLIPDEEQVCFQACVSAGGRGVQRGGQLPAEPGAAASRGWAEGQPRRPARLPHRAPTAGTQAPGAVSDVNAHELRAALWDKA